MYLKRGQTLRPYRYCTVTFILHGTARQKTFRLYLYMYNKYTYVLRFLAAEYAAFSHPISMQTPKRGTRTKIQKYFVWFQYRNSIALFIHSNRYSFLNKIL